MPEKETLLKIKVAYQKVHVSEMSFTRSVLFDTTMPLVASLELHICFKLVMYFI